MSGRGAGRATLSPQRQPRLSVPRNYCLASMCSFPSLTHVFTSAEIRFIERSAFRRPGDPSGASQFSGAHYGSQLNAEERDKSELSTNPFHQRLTAHANGSSLAASLSPQPSLSATVTNLRRERCTFPWRSSPRGPGCLVKRDRGRRRGAKPCSEPARPNFPTHQRSSRPLPSWAVDSLNQPSFQKPAEITGTFQLTAHWEESALQLTRHCHLH